MDLSKFSLPNVLRFEESPSGLTSAVVSTPLAEGVVYLHGAHVTHWAPAGQAPVLFLSKRSRIEPNQAIRGGVPIVFPWFGARGGGLAGPAHGFARITEWELESTEVGGDGAVVVRLALGPNEATRGLGYDGFRLRFRVSFGTALEMELETLNETGAEFTFEEALHSYFAIGDIDRTSVAGLEGTTYIDKPNGFQRKLQGSEPIRFTAETDRVYLNTAAACTIDDGAGGRRIVVEKSGSATTVVWNPWVEKTKSLADMAPGDWRRMVCVETANAADNAVRLAPCQSHRMGAVVRVE